MAGYYVRRGEKVLGPVEAAKLKELATAGKVVASDQVSRSAEGPWTAAAQVKGLFAAPAAMAGSPAAPVRAATVAAAPAPQAAGPLPAAALPKKGAAPAKEPKTPAAAPAEKAGPKKKSRIVAILLAFLVGAFGVHLFYLGRKKAGLIRLGLSLTILGMLITGPWALVDTVLLLLTSEQKFAEKYGAAS